MFCPSGMRQEDVPKTGFLLKYLEVGDSTEESTIELRLLRN